MHLAESILYKLCCTTVKDLVIATAKYPLKVAAGDSDVKYEDRRAVIGE
jgi:hypothetical protein